MKNFAYVALLVVAAMTAPGSSACGADDYKKYPDKEASPGEKTRTFTLSYTAKVEKVPIA